MFEMRIGGREASLPPACIPPTRRRSSLQVWRCPDSPWGPFSLAQGRVGARSGLRPRGHVQGCVCDNDAAAGRAARALGLPRAARARSRCAGTTTPSKRVVCRRRATRAVAARGNDPEPLGNGDIAYSTTVALADTPRGLRLVQIEYDVAVTRAERLRPRLDEFDAAGFGVHPSVEPYHPVSASIALGTITLHRLRFVCRPDELAFTGTEPIDA